MDKLILNHRPSVEVHGVFGYIWFSIELFLGTAMLANGESME